MLADVVEMARDLLVERTQLGSAQVNSEGKTLGRPLNATAPQCVELSAKDDKGENVTIPHPNRNGGELG